MLICPIASALLMVRNRSRVVEFGRVPRGPETAPRTSLSHSPAMALASGPAYWSSVPSGDRLVVVCCARQVWCVRSTCRPQRCGRIVEDGRLLHVVPSAWGFPGRNGLVAQAREIGKDVDSVVPQKSDMIRIAMVDDHPIALSGIE